VLSIARMFCFIHCPYESCATPFVFRSFSGLKAAGASQTCPAKNWKRIWFSALTIFFFFRVSARSA